MPIRITDTKAKAYGITTRHETMDNGSRRFRLIAEDGSSYIRCENSGRPVWENSHSHSTLRELILVQKGELIFCEHKGGKTTYTLLREGDQAVTTPGIPHNNCMSEDSVVHTIKFGDCTKQDWIPSQELDGQTKLLSFEEAKVRCETEDDDGQ